jgi:hypothetical protein
LCAVSSLALSISKAHHALRTTKQLIIGPASRISVVDAVLHIEPDMQVVLCLQVVLCSFAEFVTKAKTHHSSSLNAAPVTPPLAQAPPADCAD